MIDIARLREDPEAVRENIKKKFQDHKLPSVDEALELDKQYRAAITRASELRSMRNKLSKEILAGNINDGDRVTLDYFDETGLVFTKIEK